MKWGGCCGCECRDWHIASFRCYVGSLVASGVKRTWTMELNRKPSAELIAEPIPIPSISLDGASVIHWGATWAALQIAVQFRSPAPALRSRPPSPARAAPRPDVRVSAQQTAAPLSLSLSAPRRPRSHSIGSKITAFSWPKTVIPFVAFDHHTITPSDHHHPPGPKSRPRNAQRVSRSIACRARSPTSTVSRAGMAG
jgi:hypothetical protein